MARSISLEPTYNMSPDALVDTPATPGELFETNNGMTAYRFVKFDNGSGNVAAAAGNICYWQDRSKGIVTSDESDTTTDSEADAGNVAGVFQATITDGHYCMILVRGQDTLNTNGDDDIAKGDAIIPTTTDGVVDSIPKAATNDGGADAPIYFWKVIGTALADDVDADDTVSALVTID